jgi:hypothetical protein
MISTLSLLAAIGLFIGSPMIAGFCIGQLFNQPDALKRDQKRNVTPSAGPLKRMSWISLSSFWS